MSASVSIEEREAPAAPYADLDFVRGRYRKGALAAVSPSALPGWTFTRTGAGWAENELGVYTQFASATPRLTNKGLLMESSRTNAVRNSGWAAGVPPSTLPTNFNLSTPSGLSRSVAYGTDPVTGLPYMDVRLFGMTDAVTSFSGSFDALTAQSAVQGQTWVGSVWAALVGGSWDGVPSFGLRYRIADSGGSQLVQASNIDLVTALSPGAPLTRLIHDPYQIADPTAAFIAYRIVGGTIPSGTAIDFTVRFVAPQLEQGLAPSSPIQTTGTALQRGLDQAYLSVAEVNGPFTLFADGHMETALDTETRVFAQLSDGSNARRVLLYRSAAGAAVCLVSWATGQTATVSVAGMTGPRRLRLALAFDGQAWRGACDGVALGPLAAQMPAGLNRLDIGCRPGGSLNGWVKRVALHRRALSQAELNALTAL